MNKNKEILKTTDNASVYKKVFVKLHLHCPICPPNKGCNRQAKWNNDYECWKTNRKTQWK
jgi:hypothetical protein